MRNNVTEVILNSTVMPFRWLTTSYRCFYCYDIFDTVAELKAHNVLHERQEITNAMQRYWENDVFVDVSKLSCTECSEDCDSLSELIDHLITEHEVNYEAGTEHCFKPFILKDNEVICGVCDSTFKLFNQLLLHATKEHRNPKDYICDVCGRSFKKHQYKMHVQNEHRSKNVNCTQCGEVFSSYTIRTHMIKAHGRKVKCKMCNETFPTYYKKQQHMTLVHRTRSEFKCPHCENIFYFQSTLNRHVKETHLREKNVMCNICGIRTYSQSQMKGHMVKHQQARCVPCQYCNKMFKSEKYLKQHYHIVHAEELEKDTYDNENSNDDEEEDTNIQQRIDKEEELNNRTEVQYLEDDLWESS